MSIISRWYEAVCKLVARRCGIPCATRISRRYEVVYKSYISNLQKAGIIMALSSILLVMILDTLLTHTPFDGWKIYCLHISVILLFASSVVGIYPLALNSIDYNNKDVLPQIDRMYSANDSTFLNDVLSRNDITRCCIKIMSALTLIAISLLLLTVIDWSVAVPAVAVSTLIIGFVAVAVCWRVLPRFARKNP